MESSDDLQCRFCLNKNNVMQELFSEENEFIALIEGITGLKITEEPDLPSVICDQCLSIVKLLINFRNTCLKSEQFLREQQNEEIQVIVVQDELVETDEETENEVYVEIVVQDENEDEDKTYLENVLDKNQIEDNIQDKNDIEDKEYIEIIDIGIDKECGEENEICNEANKCPDFPTTEKEQPKNESNKKNHVNNKRSQENSTAITKKQATEIRKTTKDQNGKKASKKILHSCHICGKLYDACRLKYHLNLHSNKKPFVCKVENCDKAFPSPSQLRSHHNICHTDNYPFECDICGRRFKVKTTYLIHRSYHLDPEIPCTICGKLLRNSRSVKKHMMSHTGERPFDCKVCSKSFQNRYTWRIHQRVHTKEKPFACTLCKKSFGYNCLLKSHVQKQHPSSINET